MRRAYEHKNNTFVDGHKVKNPEAPIRDWILSPRTTKAPEYVSTSLQAYYPETKEEAWETLQQHCALRLRFDDEIRLTWHSYHTWVKLDHPDAERLSGWYLYAERALYKGFLGNTWIYDGAKFTSTARSLLGNVPNWIILKREWLAEWEKEHPEVHFSFIPDEERAKWWV